MSNMNAFAIEALWLSYLVGDAYCRSKGGRGRKIIFLALRVQARKLLERRRQHSVAGWAPGFNK